MSEKMESRVVRGAEWMDTVRPGWAKSVKLDKVDLQLFDTCVLGQALSPEVSRELCEKGPFSLSHGFRLAGKEHSRSNYLKLSGLWAAEAEKRKTAKGASQ